MFTAVKDTLGVRELYRADRGSGQVLERNGPPDVFEVISQASVDPAGRSLVDTGSEAGFGEPGQLYQSLLKKPDVRVISGPIVPGGGL